MYDVHTNRAISRCYQYATGEIDTLAIFNDGIQNQQTLSQEPPRKSGHSQLTESYPRASVLPILDARQVIAVHRQ